MTGARSRLVLYRPIGLLALAGIGLLTGHVAAQHREKASLNMRITPAIAFSPARVSVIAELRGDPAPEDEAALYCPSVEWEWGDGTRSEAQVDCEPFEPGRSEIKRRYTSGHTFNEAGRYRVQLRLKRNNKIVLASSANVQIRPGASDIGDR